MESPCLSILVPLLVKGLRERAAIARKTAVIIDNMVKVRLSSPYLHSLPIKFALCMKAVCSCTCLAKVYITLSGLCTLSEAWRGDGRLSSLMA